MANKRELKKNVRLLCAALASESMIANAMIPEVNHQEMAKIVADIAALQNNALKNITFAYPKVQSDFPNAQEYRKARHAYFKEAYTAFATKFDARVDEILARMNAALPQEVKDAKKAAAK